MREVETGGGAGRSKKPQPAPHAAVPSRPQVLAPKSKPVGVFAGGARPTAPSLGQGRAAAKTKRARQRVAASTSVAVVPKVANPTRAQRQVATDLAVKSLGGQGIHTRADVDALPARERQRANRLLGYASTQRKYDDAAAAVRAGVDPTSVGSVRDLAAAGRRIAAGRAVPLATSRGDHKAHIGVGPLQLATINLAAARRGILGATSLGGASAENAWVKNSLSDVASLGTAPLVGGLELGRAAYDASPVGVHDFKLWEPYAKSPNLKTGKELGKAVVKGISEDAAVKLVTGHPGQAMEAFRAHPGFTALDLAAALGVAGRAAGAVARGAGSTAESAGARGALARAGSRVRSPIALVNEPGSALVRREGSGDLLRKGLQALSDRTRKPVLDVHGNPVRVVDRGRTVTVLQPRSAGEAKRLANQRADFLASRANSVERLAREKQPADVMRAPKGAKVGKRGQQIVSLAVQGILRPGARFVPDLEKRIAHLEGQLAGHERAAAGRSPYRHREEVKQARAELDALKAVRASPRALKQAERIVEAGRHQGRALNAQEAEAVRLRVLEPGARRAALQPYALSHMDARHVTVEEHGRLEAAATQTEKAARSKVDALPRGPQRAAALADWRRARQHRIEVSGRDPAGVHAHEALQGASRRARADHRRAVDKLRQGREQRARVVGRKLALPHDPVAQKRLTKLRAAADAKVKRLEIAERDARKARVKAETELGASRLPKSQEALRTREGKHLPDAAIEAHMRAHGVDPADVAFLSHRELGNGAHHARFDPSTRPNLGQTERRTGAAHVRGTAGFGPEQVRDEAARKATRNSKAEQVDRLIQSEGLRHPAVTKAARGAHLTVHERQVVDRGGYFTAAEAAEVAKRVAADSGGKKKLIPVRAFGGTLSDASQTIVRQLQRPGAMEAFPGQLINDRILGDGLRGPQSRRVRNVVLMSEDELNRLQRHLTPAGEVEKLAQMLNGPFRASVLAQPRWLAGNFIEPYLVRLPMSGSGMVNIPGLLNDVRIARKTVKTMEKSGNPAMRAAAKEIQAQQFGGLFIGSRGAGVRRRAADSENRAVRVGAVVRDLPVVKQLGDAIGLYTKGFFLFNRQAIEQWAQKAGFGRSVRRDMQEISGSWTRAMVAGQRAVADAAQGLVGTSAQQAFMREQHALLGKYEGFSPRTRKIIQSIAPFLPWAMSAARFVYWTMPAHHTLKTALLVKSQQAFNEQWQEAHRPVAGLQGSLGEALPTKDGGWVDVGRYTPYGLTAPALGGDLQGLTDQFLPQVSSTVAALEGQDPFGNKLKVSSGQPATPLEKLAIALNGLAESTAGPLPSLIRRLREGGATPFADSTVFSPKTKPGSSHGMSAARRTLDPLRPTYVGGGAPSVVQGGASSSPAASGWGAVHAHRNAAQERRQRVASGWANVHRARGVSVP
jgi:hypothetical protein